MTYHFRVHREGGRLWAECVELEGCVSQGRDRAQLQKNMREALNLYLDEPESSTVLFPPPSRRKLRKNVEPVEVDPEVAFSMRLRELRIRSRLTQKQAAQRLGMSSLYSYQRLERRSNPSLRTVKKVKSLFPDFSLDSILGG